MNEGPELQRVRAALPSSELDPSPSFQAVSTLQGVTRLSSLVLTTSFPESRSYFQLWLVLFSTLLCYSNKRPVLYLTTFLQKDEAWGWGPMYKWICSIGWKKGGPDVSCEILINTPHEWGRSGFFLPRSPASAPWTTLAGRGESMRSC